MPILTLRLGSRAVAALSAQGLTAGGSLVLQVLAARQLGPAGYGQYTLLLAALLLFTALQTGWVGDSLTVMDREDEQVRGALTWSLRGFLVLGSLGGVGMALVLRVTSVAGALLFGIMVALWLLEETGRRLLMAKLRFWALVLNDAVYATVAIGLVLAWSVAGRTMTLELFIGAMAAGALTAVVVARVQLPKGEFRGGRLTRQGLGEVAGFGFWRSANDGLQPIVTLFVRATVAGVAGPSVLGQLEAARLLMAPVTTLRHGFGTLLLPSFTARAREGQNLRVDIAAGGLMAMSAAYGAVALGWTEPLGGLVTGGAFPVERISVAGYALGAILASLSLPLAQSVLVRKASRPVFVSRLAGAVVSVGLAVGIVLLFDAAWTPFAEAAGFAVTVAALWWVSRRLSAVSSG